MQNIVMDICEKFRDGRLVEKRRGLGDHKSDNDTKNNNKKKNNVRGHWGPVSGSKMFLPAVLGDGDCRAVNAKSTDQQQQNTDD